MRDSLKSYIVDYGVALKGVSYNGEQGIDPNSIIHLRENCSVISSYQLLGDVIGQDDMVVMLVSVNSSLDVVDYLVTGGKSNLKSWKRLVHGKESGLLSSIDASTKSISNSGFKRVGVKSFSSSDKK